MPLLQATHFGDRRSRHLPITPLFCSKRSTLTNRLHERNETWETVLARRIPEFGHRNWIVIADSAYPAQSNPGIETIATEADHLQVLTKTIDAIARCNHVRANVLLDAELRS